MTRNTLVG